MQAPPPVPTLLQQLEIMATRIRGSLIDSKFDWLWSPSIDAWSITEVMCHLRDVEREVHQYRFRQLISSDNAFIPGVSADEWAVSRGYHQQDGVLAMNRFLEYRRETIELLNSFAPDVWKRQGRHSFLGQTSMHEILHIAVRHDELHWEQIKSLLDDLGVDYGE